MFRGIVLAILMAGPSFAQETNVENGRDLYRTYCWQCHGFDSTGDGPMAEMLAIKTPDLTKLSARNGDAFPTEAVARQIDGRSPLLAHGGEMPIFGPSLESDQNVALPTANGQPLMTGLPLANVIVFIESIQSD
ncbi:MAG: c-type cytochrome [Rhizobiaceae bacterium]